ncbi:MAG: IS481 family transposase [Dehalococcoidia bacterium]|nr:MAG: IS481 family transposase [Dehalococcoidia bacterium]
MAGAIPAEEVMAMKKKDEKMEETEQGRLDVALFRYGVVADLLQRDVSSKQRGEFMRQKIARDWEMPGREDPVRLAETTIRGWMRAYKAGNLEALKPRVRSDLGRSRVIPTALADLLCEMKEEDRGRSVELCMRIAKESGQVPADLVLRPSSVWRLFSARGLMVPRPEDAAAEDRRRFAYAEAGQLWMSDVMHGPSIPDAKGHKHKTYLVALLDDATRLVPYCAFRFSEGVEALLAVFRESILRRGLPARLFVDNGSAFRSLRLVEVCARLGITLIRAAPYSPASKGKIERWFRTCRAAWLSQVLVPKIADLGELNRQLWAWVETVYHRTPHSGLAGMTPLDKWLATSQGVRFPDDTIDLDDVFRARAIRQVYKDRTVSLAGRAYEVDASLVGERVELRYDPDRLDRVWVHHQGKLVGEARPVDAYANCFVHRERPSRALGVVESEPKPRVAYAELVRNRAKKEP